MKIIIDIPEDTVNAIKDNAMFAKSIADNIKWDITSAIVGSTPLPKGHGRIGDLDLAYEAIEAYQDLIRSTGEFDAEKASALILLGRCKELISEIDEVIEADKG